jgi:hypothetical protein
MSSSDHSPIHVEDRFRKNESRVMNHEDGRRKEKTKRNNCADVNGTIVPGIDVCVIYTESRVLEPPVNLF